MLDTLTRRNETLKLASPSNSGNSAVSFAMQTITDGEKVRCRKSLVYRPAVKRNGTIPGENRKLVELQTGISIEEGE